MSGSFLMVTWAGGGNVNPLLCLADHLSARGHRVGALAGEALTERLQRAGLDVLGPVSGWPPLAPLVICWLPPTWFWSPPRPSSTSPARFPGT
ncbi:MAG TPA: hypothetical protein VFA11_14950 [Acidimicrobiales bacterium]|nr:hypothetical protein [Acidimicrobiales bacterium]